MTKKTNTEKNTKNMSSDGVSGGKESICRICRKDVECPLCGERVLKNYFRHHLRKVHGMEKDSRGAFAYGNAYANMHLACVADKGDALDCMFRVYDSYGGSEPYARQFESFYRTVTAMRPYERGKDNATFVEVVLPWKLSHPKISNSREYACLAFRNDGDMGSRYYERHVAPKNPFTGHDKSLSPFSKDFVGYRGLSDEEREKRAKDAGNTDQRDRTRSQIANWLKKGLTYDEAYEYVNGRRSVLSMEYCIRKHGQERGVEVWRDRQMRRMEAMDQKREEGETSLGSCMTCSKEGRLA